VRINRRGATVGTVLAGLAGVGLIAASPALAHVTANASGATQGGYGLVTFKVPTESDTARTIGLKVQLPTDNPIASVSVQPKAGWTYTLKKAKPATPMSNDDGPITEVVTGVEWKVAPGGAGIKPGEFDTFVLSAGPMPKVDTVTFKAVQTYSDGKVASWIETAAPGSADKPEHPAPTISLAAASTSESMHGSPSASAGSAAAQQNSASDDDSKGLSIAALSVGILGLLLALASIFGLLVVRKDIRKGSSTT
jgi:uncharacterized protein